VAAGLALVPSTASAKGADKATIKGPGLAAPLSFGSRGGGRFEGGGKLGRLMEETGVFPAMYESYPYTMRSEAPKAEMGAAFTIVWHMPDGGKGTYVRQLLYPYAEGGPFTYMAPGQPIEGGDAGTFGGWYSAPTSLVSMLKAEGLPTRTELIALSKTKGTDEAAAAASEGATASRAASIPWQWLLLALMSAGLAFLALKRPAAAAERFDRQVTESDPSGGRSRSGGLRRVSAVRSRNTSAMNDGIATIAKAVWNP
jgi:hypothetical protein